MSPEKECKFCLYIGRAIGFLIVFCIAGIPTIGLSTLIIDGVFAKTEIETAVVRKTEYFPAYTTHHTRTVVAGKAIFSSPYTVDHPEGYKTSVEINGDKEWWYNFNFREEYEKGFSFSVKRTHGYLTGWTSSWEPVYEEKK